MKKKSIKIGRNLWPFSQDALKCHKIKKHASKCHVVLTLVTTTSPSTQPRKRGTFSVSYKISNHLVDMLNNPAQW